MNWESLSEFLHMGGYAWYVWGSFGLTFLFLLVEVVVLRGRRRAAEKQVRRMARMEREKSK